MKELIPTNLRTHLTKVVPGFTTVGNQFEVVKNKLRLFSDGYPHFKLKIKGVGKVDCVYDPNYDNLVIPFVVYQYWAYENLLPITYIPDTAAMKIPSIIRIYGVTAFGRYFPEVEVVVDWDATKIVAGKNLCYCKVKNENPTSSIENSVNTEN